jgi:hypothetical protein
VRKAVLISSVSLLAGIASAQYPGAKPAPDHLKVGSEAISIEDAKSYLGFLAGPECEGRGTGQPGFEKAAKYVADHFKRLGFKPGGDNGTFFHSNTMWRSRPNPASTMLKGPNGSVGSAGAVMNIANGNVDVSKLAIAVYHSADEAKKGDLFGDEKINVEGKIVFVFTKNPTQRYLSQISINNPAAIITVEDKLPDPSWAVSRTKPSLSGSRTPQASITPKGFQTLVGDTLNGKVLAHTESAFAEPLYTGSGQGMELSLKAEMVVEEAKVSNVVAIFEGSDPTLKNEYVGIGAHLDHLGRRGNTIWYGADDDGSGSTGVLLVANALAKNPVKPKRSIVLMTFYGEEMGLLGSAYLANKPPFDLTKMVAEIQMDMIGRDSEGDQQNGGQVDKLEENHDTIRLVGSKRISTELDKTIQELNAYTALKFKYDAEHVYTRSDHYNFAAKGIPIAFFFDGFHPDYHQPTDTVDKINFLKLTTVAKLAFYTVHTIASREKAPVKDVKN